MKSSKYQLAKRERLAQKTLRLYKEGLTYREIQPLVGRSLQWISNVINSQHPEAFPESVDKTKQKV